MNAQKIKKNIFEQEGNDEKWESLAEEEVGLGVYDFQTSQTVKENWTGTTSWAI